MMRVDRAQTPGRRRSRAGNSARPTGGGWLRARRGAPGVSGGRDLLAAPAAVLVVGLIAFHAEILWQRLASMALLQPHVALRWALSVAVLAGLFRLRRAGVSLLKGREALVFWLAVLLIHVHFPLPGIGESAGVLISGPPVTLLFILPATATLSFVLGVVLALQAASGGSLATGTGAFRYRSLARAFGAPTLAESFPHLFSRPPPA